MNLKQATDEKLWQALKDAEDLAGLIRMEIASRNATRHPELNAAVIEETRKAFNAVSMMSRGYIGYVSEGEKDGGEVK